MSKSKYDELLDILHEINNQGNEEICWSINCGECMKQGKCGGDIRELIEEIFSKVQEGKI